MNYGHFAKQPISGREGIACALGCGRFVNPAGYRTEDIKRAICSLCVAKVQAFERGQQGGVLYPRRLRRLAVVKGRGRARRQAARA